MNQTLLATLGILCIIAVAFSGCTGTPGATTPATTLATPDKTQGVTPAGTPAALTIGEKQNGSLLFMKVGGTLTLRLAENPTTGYAWNLTATPGLSITNDTYVPSDSTGTMVGSGGTRIWKMTAVAPGMQTINAVYMRSWEPLTGNETAFTVSVDVT